MNPSPHTRHRKRRLLVGLVAIVGAAAALGVTSAAADGEDDTPYAGPTGNIHPGDSFRADELQAGQPVGALAEAAGRTPISAEATAPAVDNLRFVPVTPCRAADTRYATAGKINANTNRTFSMITANMGTQGGSVTGCGIPSWASAVGVNYAVVNPEGAGFGKAWASGTPEPATSVINFQSTGSSATANSGVLFMGQGGNLGNVTAKFSRRVDVILDVTGYYVRGAYGTVLGGGDLAAGSSLIDYVDYDPVANIGTYTVDFTSWVSGCVPHITFEGDEYAAFARHASAPGEEDQIIVDVEATDGSGGTPGNNVSGAFHISVTC